MKFLIADDSGSKHDQISQLITDHWPEAEILHAYSTEEGEAMINDHPDIVAGFIDYQIPSKDGPWLIARWREIEKKRDGKRAVIILATGQGNPLFSTFAAEATQSGADVAVSTLESMRQTGQHLADALPVLEKHLDI